MSVTNRPRNSFTLSWSMCRSPPCRCRRVPATTDGRRAAVTALARACIALTRRSALPVPPTTRACCPPEVRDGGRADATAGAGGGARAAAAGRRRRDGRGARAEAARGARAAGARRGPDRDGRHLVDALWPAEVPESGRQALHSHVSRLRGHLGPAATRLQTRPDGYRLELGADELDVAQARALLAAARGRAGPTRPRATALLREAHGALARAGARRPHRRRADRRRGRGVRAAAPGGDRRADRQRDRRRAGGRGRSASRPRRWPRTRCASPRSCC